jgi:hypothetical protein
MGDNATQYDIDVAARVAGGNESVDTLLELSDRLVGAGQAATSFDRAIADTRSALERAASASGVAANALAEGESRYAQMERAAVRAAQAVERAGQKMSGAVPADLMQKARAAEAALRGEAATLDVLRAKAAGAAVEQTRLGEALKRLDAGARAQSRLGRSTGNMGETMEKLGGVLSRFGGPLGSLGSRAAGGAGAVAKLGTALGGAVAGAVAFVAVVGLVAVGLAVAAARTAQWAIGLADAARSSGLHVEALEQSSDALVGLGDALPGVQSATGLATDHLADLAKQLAAAKVSAEDMPAALRAAATAEAALGKGGAAKFIADLEAGKATVGEFADEVDRKFGTIVARKLLGLDAQTERFKRNLSATFGGLDIEPLLAGLSRLVELFDQNTAMGQILKAVFEGVFQPIIDGVTTAIYMVEAFAIGAAITGLRVYIAFKPAIRAIKDLFGMPDSALPDALEVAQFAGETLTGIFIGMAAVLGLLAAPVIAAAAGFYMLLEAGARAWDGMKASAQSSVDWLRSISLADIAADLIDGLATGITNTGDRVVGAIKGVVGNAIAAAKDLLGIASDSKVFAAIGGHTVGGFEHEVERSTPRVRSALESMVEPPDAAPAGAGASKLLASGAGHSFQITINAAAGADGDGIAAKVKQVLLEVLEGDVTQLGAGSMEPAT